MKITQSFKRYWMAKGFRKGVKAVNEGLYPLSVDAMGKGYVKDGAFQATQAVNKAGRYALMAATGGMLDISVEDVAWAMNGLRKIGKGLGFTSLTDKNIYLPIMDEVNSILKEEEDKFVEALAQSKDPKQTSKQIFKKVFDGVMIQMDADDIEKFTDKDFIYLVERLKVIKGYISPSPTEIKKIIVSALKH